MKEFAEILINEQVIYTYAIPAELQGMVAVGQEVEIQLRQKDTTGYILRFVAKPEFKTKSIVRIVEKLAYFDANLVKLAEFISEKYKCLFPTALKAILPK